jgi:hypothetical protein
LPRTFARSAAFSAILAATIAVNACGKGHLSPPPTFTATPTDTPQPPTATATSSPSPSASGILTGPGVVITSIQATCDTAGDRALISVTYSARAQGGGNLTRVRLLDNGRVADDSGPLNQPAYERIVSVRVLYGEQHLFQVITESAGVTLNAANARSLIQCTPPVATPGPRL